MTNGRYSRYLKVAQTGRNKLLTASDLSRGEKLYLWRKRYALSQIEASVDLGVSLIAYRVMEEDGEGSNPPFKTLGALEPTEEFVTLRRRQGWTRADLGVVMEVSAEWIRKMESGLAPMVRLEEYWGQT